MIPPLDRRQLLAGTGAAVALGAMPLSAQPRPLVFAFQPQKDPAAIRKAADEVAAAMGTRLGRKVEVLVPLAYTATVQALVSRRADVAWTSSLPFLLAQRDGEARILLAELRADRTGRLRTDYDSVFVVRRDSPLASFEDLKAQAKTLRMIFTSPTSTSGFIFPLARLMREGVIRKGAAAETGFAQVSYGGGYTQALEQLLAGRGDVAAVSDYTVEGPKRTVYLPEDRQAGLRVLARTPGVPTHSIAVSSAVTQAEGRAIAQALLDMSRTSPALLSDVYGASGLVTADDRHVRATARAVAETGLPISGLVR